MEDVAKTEDVGKLIRRGTVLGTITGTVIFLALAVFVFTHFAETEKILSIIKNAEPLPLGLAVLTEISTYLCAGGVWYVIAKSANFRLPLKSLARLAVEQLSINQLIPAGGIVGNMVVVRAMKRLGLTNALAIEVLFIDLLAYYVAFSSVTFLSLVLLSFHHHITPIILSLVGVSLIIELFIAIIIWTVVNHKKLNLPLWIKKIKLISELLNSIEQISPERVFSIRILAKTSLLRLGIFLLDAGTLFLVMQAMDLPNTLVTAFIVIAMASVTGAIILIPGVIGGFEAGCIATLILLGLPVGEAIAITLLFRGLSLWVPLIPGLIMARRDLGLSEKK